MLLPFYSIGSATEKIETSLTAEFLFHFEPAYLTRPGQSLPVIPPGQPGKISPACWGIPDKSGIRQPWISLNGIIRNRYRYLVRKQRCLVPANGYFMVHAGKNYFIYFPDEKVITFGGIYAIQTIPGSQQVVTSFSILVRPAVSSLSPENPLIISKSSRRRYLNPERPLMDITRMFRRKVEMNFNGLEISPDLFKKKNPERSDFNRNGPKLYARQKFPEKEILGTYFFY